MNAPLRLYPHCKEANFRADFLHTLLAGTVIQVAHGHSTVLADLDFETYSEAGFVYDPVSGRFHGVTDSKKGLPAVGSAVYARHPSTEVLCLAYNLKDGLGPRLWEPGDEPPWDLLQYVIDGGILEAHNSLFEYFIWNEVCVKRYGWPKLPQLQLRCSMAKAASFALPMSLDKLGSALQTDTQKDKDGKAVMLKLSQPKTPTGKDRSLRYTRLSHPQHFQRLGSYCVTDISTESEISALIPDLSPSELELWQLDQAINIRGAHVDRKALTDCIAIVEQAFDKYSQELRQICGGYEDEKGQWQWSVESPAELDKIKHWLAAKGYNTPSLDAEHVKKLLERSDLTPEVRRVIEIRDMLSASSVKKLFSLLNHLCDDDRVRGLFAFCGADRTGRFAGRGPQPQNFPSGGPKLHRCDKINGCNHFFKKELINCPWCGADSAFSSEKEWDSDGVDQALKVIASRNLHYVEHYFGDPIAVVSGCLRGLFTAAEGHDLISSDFSAIEAVVAAELAGESWRQEVFRTHGKIYEMGASKIAGIPFEAFMECAGYHDLTKPEWWKEEVKGKHHPLRKTLGKVSELACFGPDTMVMVLGGYKRIVDITYEDWVWDGEAWRSTKGAIARGEQQVRELGGILVTENHPILTPYGYADADYLLANDGTFEYSIDYCDDRLPPGWNHTRPVYPPAKDCISETYDLVDCLPHHRFTIATNRGHLLVHNSGYGGWIQAWKNFGADKFMTDEEIKEAIKAWRDASPMIVEMWGGQWRKNPYKWEFTPEYYGLEGAAIQAVINPGQAYAYRSITYLVKDDILYCRLPSGRLLAYHQPRLIPSTAPHKNPIWQLTYMGQDAVTGQWVRLSTYGGKLFENVVQAVARDLLTNAMINVSRAGYPIVLHIHDELVAEVPKGWGSILELEALMGQMPDWAKGWPVKAAGGWRGLRYRKG